MCRAVLRVRVELEVGGALGSGKVRGRLPSARDRDRGRGGCPRPRAPRGRHSGASSYIESRKRATARPCGGSPTTSARTPDSRARRGARISGGEAGSPNSSLKSLSIRATSGQSSVSRISLTSCAAAGVAGQPGAGRGRRPGGRRSVPRARPSGRLRRPASRLRRARDGLNRIVSGPWPRVAVVLTSVSVRRPVLAVSLKCTVAGVSSTIATGRPLRRKRLSLARFATVRPIGAPGSGVSGRAWRNGPVIS